MRPDFRAPRHSAGFGLVAALFLMIVVTVIIMTMAHLSAIHHGTSSLAIQQARAYQAARAGLEWGIARAVNAGECQESPFLVDMSGSEFSEFSIVVQCEPYTYEEQGVSVHLFRLFSQAENGRPDSRPDYSFRQLTATIER